MTSKFTYPQSLINRARLLYSRKWSPKDIRGHLIDEGFEVPVKTISNWCYRHYEPRPKSLISDGHMLG